MVSISIQSYATVVYAELLHGFGGNYSQAYVQRIVVFNFQLYSETILCQTEPMALWLTSKKVFLATIASIPSLSYLIIFPCFG